MSKLEQLIAELCPNGVEYKTLNDVGTFLRGKRFVRSDLVDNGVPCIHYGDLYKFYGIFCTEPLTYIQDETAKKMRFAKYGDVIIVGAGENKNDIGIGVAWLCNKEAAVHDACYIFSHNENPKYISYFLRSSAYHQQILKYVSEGKICSISSEGIGKSKIPVPPLPVQEEIVRTLDTFTELTAELTAELTKRKKQYEYYRDKLLSFKELEA